MADLRDFTKKNPVFVGTDGIRLPSGNNAQRLASANVDATLRYNTDIGGMEVYSPNGWTPLAAPPTISTVSPAIFSGLSGTSFEIQGTNINPDAQVYFVTSNGATLLASTITYFGSSQIRATTPRDIIVAEEPLSVRLVQQSGTVTKLNCIDAGGHPDWVTTAGTLGSIFGANTVNVYVTATDPEGTAVSYQLSTGALPGGLSFTTSNGLIQGVASSVLANTTYNFTIKASDTVNNNTNRTFSYTVLNRPPVINTAAGSLGTVYSGNAIPTTTISAYDPDGGSVTYAVASGLLPTNSSLGTANGVIQGTPIVVTTNTTYTFSISATDEGNLTASNTYTYTVLNRPPLWNTESTLTSYSAETFTPITVNAYDPDGGSVTYALTSGSVPSGLTFVSANATITGSATEVTDNTTSTFTVTATDPGSDANTRTFSLTITPIIDPQFANTILLLKTTDNTVIKDNSSSNLPLTVVNDARASNFSPFNTTWSTYFTEGSTQAIRVAANASLEIGTGDYTFECWINTTNALYTPGYSMSLFGTTDESSWGSLGCYSIAYRGGGNGFGGFSDSIAIEQDNGTQLLYWGFNQAINNGVWHHIAITRKQSTTTWELFIDGISKGTTTTNGSKYLGKSTYRSAIGTCEPTNGDPRRWAGYISNLRISNAVLYTSTFTPSTTRLTSTANTVLLACQSGRFIDNGPNQIALTPLNTPSIGPWSPHTETDTSNGSIYFDGTGDYISNLPSDLLDFAPSEEFSIEFFAYFNSVPSSFGMLGLNAGIQQGYCIVYATSSGYLLSGKTDEIGSASLLSTGAAGTLYPYRWHHICFARRSGVMSIYLDGVRVATRSSDTTTYAGGAATVGYAGQGSATAMNGFMSNLRILTGSSAYNTSLTTLTVPTSPVSNISGTRLLTFQNRRPHNNHTFQDTSANKHIVSRFGNATQGTFTPFSIDPRKWSVYFDGASDYLRANTTPMTAGGDLTIEAFVYPLTSSMDGIFDGGAGIAGILRQHGTNLFGHQAGPSVSVACTPNRWSHVVMQANSTYIQAFVNGVSTGTSAISSYGVGFFDIGTINTGTSGSFNGYISNFRVSNTRVYTANFTPPTNPLPITSSTVMLTCASNKFEDLANYRTFTRNNDPKVTPFSPFTPNNAYNITTSGGSMYIGATPDGVKFATSSTHFGTSGDYTVSMWYYPTGTTTDYNPLFIFSDNLSSDNPMAGLFFNSGYSLFWLNDGAGGNGFNANMGITIVPFQWNHIAVTRTSGTTRCWTNGILRVDGWSAGSMNSSKRMLCVGTNRAGGDATPGYISGFQFLNGTSLYTTGTNFTPPTIPPTPVANTAALLNFTDAGVYDATGKINFQTVGDARANTTNAKFGLSSFSAGTTISTGSYLSTNDINDPQFRTGDFTVEAWIRLDTTSFDHSAIGPIVSYGNGGGNGPLGTYSAWQLDVLNGGAGLKFYRYDGSETIHTFSGTINANRWHHVTICRSGTSIRSFVDGTQIGSTVTSSFDYSRVSGTNRILVGVQSGGGGNAQYYRFPGLIQDLRVTKTARYVANFTPPTRSFPIK